MPGPLAGVRVLDLTSVVSGPLATMFLADQGAEVIKIEPLGGDITRRSRQSISASGEFSALFVSSNRGKRSLALDLKRPEAAKIMHKLIAGSDVLVQNFRPGTMERLGFGEPAVCELNPRLIYVSISGVGEIGPYARKRSLRPDHSGSFGLRRPPGGAQDTPAANDSHDRCRQDYGDFCGSGDNRGPFCP